MKKVIALTALSAALIATSALAADAAAAAPDATAAIPAAKPAPKPPSEMVEALSALGKELKAVIGSGKGNPIAHLDKLAAHQYSDATRAKISKVFGPIDPLRIERSAAAKGMVGYAISAPAFSYTDVNASKFDWTELRLDLLIDKAGRNLSSHGSWPSFSVGDSKLSMTMSDLVYDTKQRRNERDTWIGKGTGSIAKVTFAPQGPDAGAGAVLEGLSFTSSATQHGAAVDVGFDTKVNTLRAGGQSVDDIRFVMRMTNIDMRMFEKFTDNLQGAERAGMAPKQSLALVAEQFKVLGKNVAAHGSAIEFDEISAGFHGNRAVIKGKVSLAPSSDADFASLDKVAKKLIVRLNVQVPVALVTDVARLIMAKQAEAKKEPMSEGAIAQGAQSVADVIVGKLLNGGMAKLENGVLLSTIEFKGGKLTFNGKEVALPKTGADKAKAEGDAKPADAASAD
jgi:uncharacterized protein YdgA (DUF945 family)